MWQTQSTIHNLGRISEEVGINLLNCPLTHSWVASNLAICWDPDKLEPEAKLSTCGVLDDFGVFFHENHDLSEMGNWNPTPWRTQRV